MYFDLEPSNVDKRRLQAERDKARQLRKSPWWFAKIRAGVCHYCQSEVGAEHLTMDHVVPLARGGTSSKNNLVPSCRACNASKKLETPVEALLRSGL